MDFLSEIKSKYEIFVHGEISSIDSINDLKTFSPVAIPQEYFDIIENSEEIEFIIKDWKQITIWNANSCIEINRAYNIQKYISQSISICDVGHDNILLYANGKKGFGLYIAAFNNLDIDEMMYISKSLKDFILKEIGIDVFMEA